MSDIVELIKIQESEFQNEIPILDGMDWNMQHHIKLTILYKHSVFETGSTMHGTDRNNDHSYSNDDKPFKNIIRPILNLQYRTEGFDVTDIELFVDDSEQYYKSFLLRKFHEKWAREQKLDTFIDELVESYVDFGGVLVKNVKGARPEVVPLVSLAFADQTDILSGPFGIKHFFTPDQLRKKEKFGWENIEEIIAIAENTKAQARNDRKTETPGKYIEIYEVHNVDDEDEKDRQMFIVNIQNNSGNKEAGTVLFQGKEPKDLFKFLKRGTFYGRALGFGGAEELFEAQVWTNYAQIQIKAMLDAASKIIHKTTDPNFANRNRMDSVENNEILVLEEGHDIAQMDTTPRNLQAFDNYVTQWEEHGRIMGSVADISLGEQPASGTPFKSVEAQLIEGRGLHEYRKGQIATFVDEIYMDWIVPHLAREVSKDQEFLAELDLDEMTSVANALIENQANTFVKERILSGQLVFLEEVEARREQVKADFEKGGNKRFLKILKGEMKDAPVTVRVNIAGKQKDLAKMTDKMVNILRQIIATPQILQDPNMVKLLNRIFEASGFSPIAMGTITPIPQQVEGSASTQPLKQIAQGARQEAKRLEGAAI